MADNKKKYKIECDGDTCTRVAIKDDEAASAPTDGRVEYKNKKKVIEDENKEEGPANDAEGAKFLKLLGDELLDGANKDKKVATKDLIKNDVVALYFSAHWCPPCRGFTPMFAKNYKTITGSGKKFDVIFVSSDNNQKAFDDYLSEMPWKALPYSDRARKAKLSKKFKVQGIPTVILLDPKTGKVTEKNGRAKISSDPEGKDFPWIPAPLSDTTKDMKILTKDDKEISFTSLVGQNKYTLLYFSAHWCPPCRNFTPSFAKWYEKNYKAKQGTDQSFDVVFLSADKDEEAFTDYYKSMPWKAVPFKDRKGFSAVSEAYGIGGYPTVVVIDKDLNMITDNGRFGVMTDADAKELPWPKKSILNFNSEPNDISSYPSVVFFLDKGVSAEDQKTALALLEKLGDARKAECAKEDEDLDMCFFHVSAVGGPGNQLRKMMSITDNDKVTCGFVDLDKGKYKIIEDALTEATIKPLAEQLAKGTLALDKEFPKR